MSIALTQAKAKVDTELWYINCQYFVVKTMLWYSKLQEVRVVRRCQKLVREFSHVFDETTRIHREFVERVASGTDEYNEKLELDLKRILGKWTKNARGFLTQVADPLIQRGHQLEGYEQLAGRIAMAEESSKVDFDSYALERMHAIELPRDEIRRKAVSISEWPEY